MCGKCLSHSWYYLFSHCVLYVSEVPEGCDDYIICTTNWFLQISLEARNWLVYEGFVFSNTNLLIELPWPSRKQSTFFISSNSNLVFLKFSISSGKSDPLICVDLVLWKELVKCLLYIIFKSLFFAMLGLLSPRLFWGWNDLPPAPYQRIVHSWQQLCHWIGTWKVCTDKLLVSSWNRMHPIFVATL